jgi:SHS2 domain-containing protein
MALIAYDWVDHTSELELRVETSTEEGVFEEALAALGELLAERSTQEAGDPVRFEVDASAPDRATLLAEWLSELVYLAETDGFIPERVDELTLSADGVQAAVSGRRASPPHLVKAVTYHRLALEQREGAWHATVVLDV